MKSEKSLRKSMTARIKDAEDLADLICDQAAMLRHQGFDGKVMAAMRYNLNKLNQAVHEYAAYRNSYETD